MEVGVSGVKGEPPGIEVEIGGLCDEGAPGGKEVVAEGGVGAFGDGEDEEEVGVCEVVELFAGGAGATGIGGCGVEAIEVASEGKGEREGTMWSGLGKEEGVGEVALVGIGAQAFFEGLLSEDVFEVHGCKGRHNLGD